MKYQLLLVLAVSLVGLMIPSAFAENVPEWVKNTAGWWAADQIDDLSFLQGIQYLIKEGIMIISPTETSESTGSQEVPGWIKNNAGWWADGQIDDGSFLLGIQWLISNGIIIVEGKLIHTEADFRVAFIGDQGLGPNSFSVLELIKDEGAQMVLHQGDLDYLDDPDAWDKMVSDVLGDDFPYFVSVSDHDVLKWNEYQEKLYDRLKKNPDANCIGDFGVKSSCIYKGLFFILVAPGIIGSDYDSFIENQLNNNDYIWRVCSWSKNMTAMQLGHKDNITGWEVYENCKNGGAIIATASEHSYHRTKTLIDVENQIVDSEWSERNKLRINDDSTFVFVSGLGGKSIRAQERCLPVSYPYGCNEEWASVYTSDQDATYGALFCTFSAGGQPNKAYCYFKDIDGRIIDEFTITSFLGTHPDNVDLIDADMSGKDLTGADFSNTVIIDTDLSNAILIGADLSNVILIGSTLIGADLTNANLTGVSLAYKDLTGTILRGADLTDGSLTGVDLTDKDLTGTILRGTDLTDANLTGVDLTGRDLTGTILRGMDLTDKDLTGTILRGANISNSILTEVSLSGKDLTETILRGMNLTDKDLTGTILRGADLTDANLLGQDLSDHDLTDVILTGADLSNSLLPDNGLSGKNFERTIFNWVDFSGKDLSYSDFSYADFANANLENTNLDGASFIDVDLTKIKNKSLADADLSDTSFAYSNLSGISLAGAILESTNLYNANLSGVDFTVSDVITDGLAFIESNLSNSNFEGVNLSPKAEYSSVFKNKAYLVRGQTQSSEIYAMIKKDLFDQPVLIISAGTQGNDLVVNYMFFNSFARANLENANFKNAKLWNANFYLADLTNADLSGADLRKAFLSEADLSNTDLSNTDLSNANLEGAVLDNAILSNANLNCLNHPICLND